MKMNNYISIQNLQSHYNWLINSPLLFKSGLVANTSYQTFFCDLKPQQLNFNEITAVLDNKEVINQKQHYHLPLGKYVEFLFEKHFEHAKDIQLIQHNTQIQGNNSTIGEIDYLLAIDEEVIHVELAIKFYLCYKNPQNPEHWIGPNAKDNLANKLAKNDHAFSLTKNETYQRNWLQQPSHWQWLIKGCWFFHPSQKQEILATANPASELGIWMHANEVSNYLENYNYAIPSKIEWIRPNETQTNPLNKTELVLILDSHFIKSKRAVMVWNLKTLTRICIVNNEWPSL
jgi:hypothetical protein